MVTRSNPLRSLPAVETLLQHPLLIEALREVPRAVVVEAVRAELDELRGGMKTRGARKATPADPAAIAARAAARARAENEPMLKRLLNATGVVLHTNLGRAPLSKGARRAVDEVARGYSSLEFNLEAGKRGERGVGVERWLTRLTGAEAALVVNNGAAALLLALSAIASGKRVLVSRGELIEIGGSFRIPAILEKSGAALHEVGTTNRTHLSDYERALDRDRAREIAAILRVHPSNFRVQGFTARPGLGELARLARKRKVTLIEDLGSGALVDLSAFGLEREPTVRESLNAGCDLVTFSGDKLLGATQAGLILGRSRLVDQVRRDPLARALRVDKLTLAALEATLPSYADPERAAADIPALAMLRTEDSALRERAERLADALRDRVPGLRVQVERGAGEVGGGALPLQRLPGWVVAVERPGSGTDDLDDRARRAQPPVIGYIRNGKYRLDVRTLLDDEIAEAAVALGRAWKDAPGG
jgi:L-seryl-tRNA(Ser) seleniumtransferase